MKHIRKALTFRAASIGDALMGKYLLENVHAVYPNARFAIITGSRGAMLRDLLSNSPWLEVREVNRRNLRSILSLFASYFKSDLVVTQYAGKKGGRFSTASKVVARLLARLGALGGFTDAASWSRPLYDHLVPFDPMCAPAELERRLLAQFNIPIHFSYPVLQTPTDTGALERLHFTKGTYVLMHLFAGNNGRGLSPERKVEIVRAVRDALPASIELVLTGGTSDRAEAEVAAAGARVIAGDVSLQELMQLITNSVGVVSVDTGVAHMTAQLGKPLIVLRTCLGKQWWVDGQYPQDASIEVLEHDAVCVNGHLFKDFPDCIGGINCQTVATSVHKHFIP